MRRQLFFFMLVAAGLTGCTNENKVAPKILSQIHIDKEGPEVKQGDFISLNVVIRNEADSIVSSTYYAGVPQLLVLPKPLFSGDVFDAVKLLSEGDSATFKFPLDSVFKTLAKPAYFKGKYTIYDMKVEKVIPKDDMTDQEFQEKINSYLSVLNEGRKNAEPASIKKYIADNKWQNVKTDSGMYYIITKKGTGPIALKNDTVVINYTAKLLTGKLFDTNVFEEADKARIVDNKRQYAPMGIPAGQRMVIAGWDKSLLMLNKGAEATYIIPSALAFGSSGDGRKVPPFSPVIYDLQVVKIIHPKPAGKK